MYTRPKKIDSKHSWQIISSTFPTLVIKSRRSWLLSPRQSRYSYLPKYRSSSWLVHVCGGVCVYLCVIGRTVLLFLSKRLKDFLKDLTKTVRNKYFHFTHKNGNIIEKWELSGRTIFLYIYFTNIYWTLNKWFARHC